MGRVGKLLLAAGILALLGAAEMGFHALSRFAGMLEPGRLEMWIGAGGAYAPALHVLLMAIAVVSPLPTLPLTLAGGRLFGPVAGTLYSVLGASLGALVSFSLARWLGRDFIARFFKGHILSCETCSDRLLTKVVLLGRLVPVVPFDLVSYAAGLTRMSAWKFAAANLVGMLPLTFAYSAAGEVVFGGRGTAWVAGGVMLALFFLLPLGIERYDLFTMRKLFQHGEDPEAGRTPKE